MSVGGPPLALFANGDVLFVPKDTQLGEPQVLTYATVCSRMLTYAHVCSRMLTYAHVCSLFVPKDEQLAEPQVDTLLALLVQKYKYGHLTCLASRRSAE